MAIDRITGPSALPITTADYQAQNALIAVNALQGVTPFSGGNILKGAVFNIGGVLYKATSNTAISGTASPYVKITAAGATASAAYVASLAGVVWNDTYNGYYDGVNLVVFDEGLAIKLGQVTTVKKYDTNRINGKLHGNSVSGFYDKLALVIPNISDCIRLSGGASITVSPGVYSLYSFSYAERIDALTIRLYAVRTYTGGVDVPTITWDIVTASAISGLDFVSVAW